MNVSVGERWKGFVERAVKSGRYGSAGEVVREGLRLVEEREARLQALQGSECADLSFLRPRIGISPRRFTTLRRKASGRPRPQLRPDIRGFPFRSYVIFFRYNGNVFEVVNVREGHRDAIGHFRDDASQQAQHGRRIWQCRFHTVLAGLDPAIQGAAPDGCRWSGSIPGQA